MSPSQGSDSSRLRGVLNVHVRWPDGDPAINAEVMLKQTDLPDSRPLLAGRVAPGEYRFIFSEVPRNPGVPIEVSVRVSDEMGVEWRNSLRATIRPMNFIRINGVNHMEVGPRISLGIDRSFQFQVPELFIDGGVRSRIKSLKHGIQVLYDYDEMIWGLKHGLPGSTSAVCGKVLEGVLMLRGQWKDWWVPDWDEDRNLTLGRLLQLEPVKKDILESFGHGFFDRLSNPATMRVVGAHQKWTKVTMAESTAACTVILELINGWF